VTEGRGSRSTVPLPLSVRAAGIRLLLLDVDGVLTDGRLWYGPQGEALKVFDVKDGHGLVLLRDHVDLGVISARPGDLSRRRLEELKFKHIHFERRDKLACYQEVVAKAGCAEAEVAYMGDDLNDLPLLQRVGLGAAPADAVPAVRDAVHLVTRAPGGRGAVREVCELILGAKGLWPPA
jgi:3-deoxy-D-manno-octulosonate 8-phosphate phosphatase (KDO 8-P phosphatase)